MQNLLHLCKTPDIYGEFISYDSVAHKLMIQNEGVNRFSVSLSIDEDRYKLLDKICISLLLVLIVYTPLPFGSVQYSSIFFIEIVSSVCFLLWLIKLCLTHKISANTNNASDVLIDANDSSNVSRSDFSFFGYRVRNTRIEIIVLLFLILIVFQLIPLPDAVQKFISPVTAELYRSSAKLAGSSAAFYPISLDPFVTFSKLLEYASYFMIYVVVVNTIKTRRHFQIVLVAFFVSAIFQGVYGLYEFLSGNQQIFSYDKKYNLDCVTGTFINRNHFAAYLELSLPLLLALVVGRINRLKSFRGKILVRISHALETEGSKILLLLFLIALVAVALVFSLSRSGITFAIVSSTLFFFLYYRTSKRLNRKFYIISTVAAVVAISVWIGLEPLLERFFRISDQFSEKEARLSLWKNTIEIFLNFPIAGTGAGTFKEVFSMFRTFPTHLSFNEAHNDYLQLLSETGLFAFFLLIAFFTCLIQRIRRVISQHLNRIGVIQVGCFCSILSLGMHSVTDFSFQIPAVALAGAIITGLFFGNYHYERSQ